MPRYRAYCLTIQSDVELPELPTTGDEPDLVLRVGEVHVPAPREHSGYMPFVADGEQTVLFLEGVGKAAIRGGREIVVEPAAGSDGAALRAFVVGPTMAQLLSQRGLEVLHASAVMVGRGAVAFLGPPGSGKSTLAGILVGRGHQAVADDVLALRRDDGRLLATPAFPRLKLGSGARRALGEDEGGLPSWPSDKHFHLFDAGFPADPVPLERIYVIGAGRSAAVEDISAREAMVELLRNSWGARVLDAVAPGAHFRNCATIARTADIRLLRRPPTLESLQEVASAVEADVAAMVGPK